MRKIFILAAVWLALLGAASPEETLRAIAIAERHRTLADLPALLDREPAIAARAALAIGRVGNSAGVAPLEAHLGARDPAVLAMVVYGLGLLDDTRELTRIRQLARGADDGAVRYAAVDAIGRIVTFRPQLASKAVADDLLAVVQHDAEPAVRGHAAASLDVFGKSPFAPAIAAALERSFATEKDRRSRWHIAWVIARAYPMTASAAFLRRALASPEELVRLEAVRAWGQRSKASPAVVLPLTKDSSWRVQLEAIEALHRLSGKPATNHLTKLPPGLRLPKIPPVAEAPSTVAPQPASPPKPGLPTDDQAILQPLLGPVLPALMNGPMPGPHPRVRIVTSKGAIVVRLYPEWAPYTVA
ncbi:MAG: HEAT repeat domain-containing protein, partial [Vulcanimicrobiaceae bacterium]